MARTTAKDVILELLRASGGEWDGKTRLYKAFYFAHLYHAADNASRLTTHAIARMPRGPAIDKGADLLHEMEREGLITIETAHEGPFPVTRYRLTDAGRNAPAIPSNAASSVRRATEFCAKKTAAELSEITHEHSRSWRTGRDGDILDVEIDLIPEDEFEARDERLASLEDTLKEVMRASKA